MSIQLPFQTDASERREIARLLVRYNLAEAIRCRAEKRPLQGVEAEVDEMVGSRSRLPFTGNLHVPSVLFRTGTAGDFETTGSGAEFVGSQVANARTSPRNAALLDALGVQTIQSSGSDITLPSYTAGVVAIKGEGVASDSSAAEISSVTLSPQRATAHTTITNQLLIQGGSDAVINSLVAELRADVARLIDRTAFSALVSGITTNVEEASSGSGTTARPLSQDMLDDMLRAAFSSGADLRRCAYLASPSGWEDIQAIQTNNVFALDKVTQTINGRPFYASQELLDHTDGTARVVVGDFSKGMVKVDFGLVDIGVNPHELDVNHQVRITLHQYFDVKVTEESVFTLYREEQ